MLLQTFSLYSLSLMKSIPLCTFLMQPTENGHLGCFCFMAVVNSTVVDMLVQMSPG